MDRNAYVRLVLKSVPSGEVEKRVATYLKRLFKSAPPDKIDQIVKKAPITLIKRIPRDKAEIIAANLNKLGADAVVAPEKGPAPKPVKPEKPEPAKPVVASAPIEKAPSAESRKKNRSAKSGSRKIRWIYASVLGICLILTIYSFFYRYSGGSGSQNAQPVTSAEISTPVSRIDFSAPRPVSKSSPTIMEVAPEDMYEAFAYQYRFRPDRRFIRAFEILTLRMQELKGIPEDAREFQVGATTANAEAVHIPLLQKGQIVHEIAIPLPMEFSETLSALDEWASFLKKEGLAEPDRSAKIGKAAENLESALRLIDRADPRYVALGLNVLEESRQKGNFNSDMLKAGVRGYAMLLLTLTPDVLELTDDFASEALALLAMARQRKVWDSFAREEALLAMGMGYSTHADFLLNELDRAAAGKQEGILDAYMRRDIKALEQRTGPESDFLGAYLPARLYREMGLRMEAKAAAGALMERFPDSYPGFVENILSGHINLAKKLTIAYPLDILARMEKRFTLESLENEESWEARMINFLKRQLTDLISPTAFEDSLKSWEPFGDQDSHRFFIDEQRVKTVYRILYTDALHLRFRLLFDQWNVTDQAVQFVDSISEKGKSHPLVLWMKGRVRAETGNAQAADAAFKQIINHSQSNGGMVYNAFTELSDMLEKVRLLPKAVDRMDGRPDHLLKTAVFFQYQVWNYDLAARFYKAGLKLDPYRFRAYQELARVSGSAAPLLDAMGQYPYSFRLLETTGNYLADQNDRDSKEKAVQIYEQARLIAPSRAQIAKKHAKVLADLGRYEEALVVLDRWRQKYAERDLTATHVIAQCGSVCLKMGQPETALSYLEDEVPSYQAGVMLYAAKAYDELGRTDEAKDLFQKLVERYPTDENVLSGAAAFCWRHGDYERAAGFIVGGHPVQDAFSRWYFDDFLEVFGKAGDEEILRAIKAIEKQGASNWETASLAWALDEAGRPGLAFEIADGLKSQNQMENLEYTVDAYRLLKKWKGDDAARKYLHKKAPRQLTGHLMMVLYKTGLFDALLQESGDPESFPKNIQEFAWLQKLIAWLALDRKSADLEEEFMDHYAPGPSFLKEMKDKVLPGDSSHSNDYYFDIGRYLLGLIPRDELLAEIRTVKQRCEIPYYIGMAERLNGNFFEAAQWYHLCRETLLRNNGEFHWASDELFWWAHMGLENRHRLVNDDIAAYRKREAQGKESSEAI